MFPIQDLKRHEPIRLVELNLRQIPTENKPLAIRSPGYDTDDEVYHPAIGIPIAQCIYLLNKFFGYP
jgi:hypothetical protein